MRIELYTDLDGLELFKINETFWGWDEATNFGVDVKFTVDVNDTFYESDESIYIKDLKSVVFEQK